MVGDTSFDMEMACNARVAGLGVAWGYHGVDLLAAAGARSIVHQGSALLAGIEAHFAGQEAGL
jgi:phosphoglycolate phosphatase